MAGQFELLFSVDFTTVDTVTVTHNQDRLQVGVIVRIGNVSRNDLVQSITPLEGDPRNAVVVVLTSAQTGSVLISDTDYVFANIPTPEGAIAAAVSATDNTTTSDPTVNDDGTQGYVVGSRWINTTGPSEFVCSDAATGAAVWTSTTSASSSAVYADFYGSASVAVGTSAMTLGLNTTRQSSAAFVLSSDTVTVQPSGVGDYLVRYDVTTNESATGGQGVDVWLEVDSVEVVASRSKLEHYTSGTDNTAGRSMILTLADANVLRLRAQLITGGGTIDTLAGGVSLEIYAIGATGATGPQGPTGAGSSVNVEDSGSPVAGGPHSTLNFTGAASAVDAGGGVATINLADAKFANYYRAAQYIAITTTASTLPFDSTRISDPAFTLNGAGEELTINTASTYRVDFGCSSGEASSNDIVASMWLERDAGGGFAEVDGTRARWFHDSNGEEGGSASFCTIALGVGDVLRVRAQVISGSDDLNTAPDSLRLNIQTVGANGADGATGDAGPQGPAGSGSTINIEDEGSAIPNTPHANLDFVGAGVTATDAGGGVATITIPGGSGANVAQYRQTANLTIDFAIATTVPLNATDFQDSNFTAAPLTGLITINTAGVYRISYNVYFDTNTNARRTVDTWCENNSVEIVPSRAAAYSRNTTDDTASSGTAFLVQLAASDVVRLRCQSTGTSGIAIGQGNRMWLTLEFVRS